MEALPPGEYVGNGDEYLFAECPNCLKESHFYYNVRKHVGECKVCGFWLKGLKGLAGVEGNCYRPEIITAGQCHIQGSTKNAWFDDAARDYLIRKGVSREQSLRLPILLEPEKRRISCPIDPLSPEYPPTSLVRYFTYSDSKWYARPGEDKMRYVFNGSVLKRKKLLVMEGIFDVLAPRLEDYALALLGTQFGKNKDFPSLLLSQLSRSQELYVWFDWDEAGIEGTQKLLQACNIWGLTAHDLTSIMKIDPKLMTPNLGAHEKRVIDLLKEDLDKC